MGWICLCVLLSIMAICDMIENILRAKYKQTRIENMTVNVQSEEVLKK